jgi:ATP-binding cassette, subfamily C (CFTR/MRP), member 1
MLGDMKAVKMLGLGDVMFAVISKLREIEIKTSERFRKFLIWQISLCKRSCFKTERLELMFIANVPTDFAPFATFTTYAIISVVKTDGSLNMAQAFTSLSLISLLTSPLLTFCQALPSVVQTLACFGRIEEYILGKLESAEDATMATSAEGLVELQEVDQSASDLPLISFANADISWSPETQDVLHDLNLDIPAGITMLVGPVGSGKSTLLETIIGQTAVKRGSMASKLSKVAYCCQTPWIMDDTIQENITGGTDFDSSWYQFTLSACGLEADMKAIPRGDMHRTGSKGVSLSSGQKQRVVSSFFRC